MRRNRSVFRWLAVAVAVAVLVSLPSLLARRSVASTSVSAATLLAKVRASAAIPWTGYGESRGDLALPDVPSLGDLASLVGDTTRTRTFWRGPDEWRVDTLALNGETDVAQSPVGFTTYSSADRAAVQVQGDLSVHLPRSDDLVAPMLGRRLAGTTDVQVTRIAGRRVAGVDAQGIRLAPAEPATTTIGSVDEWVDPSNGIVLELEIRAAGQSTPALTSLLLDYDIKQPSVATASLGDGGFPDGIAVTSAEAPDITTRLNSIAPYYLPDSLAGLPRSTTAGTLGTGGIGTYGSGFAQVVVIPLARGIGNSLIDRLVALGGTVSSPLFNVEALDQSSRRRYLLAGSVPVATLTAVADDLTANPPQRRDPNQ